MVQSRNIQSEINTFLVALVKCVCVCVWGEEGWFFLLATSNIMNMHTFSIGSKIVINVYMK